MIMVVVAEAAASHADEEPYGSFDLIETLEEYELGWFSRQ